MLCVVGDGSAMYSPQALWTAASRQLPVVFAVVNNRQYAILKANLRRMAGGGRRRRAASSGMDLDRPPVDFCALAASMGVPAQRVEKAADVGPAAEAAWASGRPALLELPIATYARRAPAPSAGPARAPRPGGARPGGCRPAGPARPAAAILARRNAGAC